MKKKVVLMSGQQRTGEDEEEMNDYGLSRGQSYNSEKGRG